MPYSVLQKSIKNILIILLVTVLLGCTKNKINQFDLQTGYSKDDLKKTLFTNKNKAKSENKIPSSSSIPKSSNMIILPSMQRANNQQLISFSITDTVPLKDVLIELAKSAKLDLDLNPNIDGGVVINAVNRPLTEVLDRICDMGKLRYSLVGNVLHIEQDKPYSKHYPVDFLIDGKLWGEVESNIMAIISETSGGEGGSISSNKLSNMMTIFASQKGHKKIVEYLEKIKKSSSAQVLIEAKVVEVSLNDTYKTGIDWNWAGDGKAKVSSANNVSGNTAIQMILGSSNLLGGTINSTISALEQFGVVRAISSPRLNALNNQQAKLNFTKKLVYFTNDVATTVAGAGISGSGVSQNSVVSTMHEENTGTELTITSSIDLVTNEITLDVKPKITISTDSVKQIIANPIDPAHPLENEIPIINTRELNTIAKIKSGSVLVIGGLMGESSNNVDSGVPFLSRIPILGYLFKSVSRDTSITETVIFIKATIIDNDNISTYDRDLENKFSASKRPFFNSP